MIYYKDEKGRVNQKHTFSIASSPFENGTIRLGIRVAGPFTQGIARMKEGDRIFVSGPYGNFTFKKDHHLDLVFIAGGVGITPFISAIRYAASKQLPNKMALIYSNRNLRSTLFLEEILELERQNENFRALFSVTDEELPYEMQNVLNRRVDARILKRFLGETQGKTFFICGPGGFMEAMKENLKRIGVEDFQIETEAFSMIPDKGFRLKIRNTAYALGFAAFVFFLPFYLIVQRSAKNLAATANTATVTAVKDTLPQDVPTPARLPARQVPTPVPTDVPTPTSTNISAPVSTPTSTSASSAAAQNNTAPAPKPRTKVS